MPTLVIHICYKKMAEFIVLEIMTTRRAAVFGRAGE